jgi:hypothetical protein
MPIASEPAMSGAVPYLTSPLACFGLQFSLGMYNGVERYNTTLLLLADLIFTECHNES